jgi:hypothetical protein
MCYIPVQNYCLVPVKITFSLNSFKIEQFHAFVALVVASWNAGIKRSDFCTAAHLKSAVYVCSR